MNVGSLRSARGPQPPLPHQPLMRRRSEAPPTLEPAMPDSFWLAMAGGGAAAHCRPGGRLCLPCSPLYPPLASVLLSAGGDLDPSTTAQELQQLFSSVAPCSVDLRQGAGRVDSGRCPDPSPAAAAFAYVAFDAPPLPRPRTRGKKHGCWQAGRGTRGGGDGSSGGGEAPTRVLLQVRCAPGCTCHAGSAGSSLHAALQCLQLTGPCHSCHAASAAAEVLLQTLLPDQSQAGRPAVSQSDALWSARAGAQLARLLHTCALPQPMPCLLERREMTPAGIPPCHAAGTGARH